MNVVIKISEREAIPVRALPLLTDWNLLSPDICAQAFGKIEDVVNHFPHLSKLPTFLLSKSGQVKPYTSREWRNWVVREMLACDEEVDEDKNGKNSRYKEWRRRSLAILPASVFVWKDEFESAFALEYGPESLRSRAYGNIQEYESGELVERLEELTNPDRTRLHFDPENGPGSDWRQIVMLGFEQPTSDDSSGIRLVTRKVLIERQKHAWPTIESDISNASVNGLRKVARAKGQRGWVEANALQWAEDNGKLSQLTPKKKASPLPSSSGPPSIHDLPRTQHRLKG